VKKWLAGLAVAGTMAGVATAALAAAPFPMTNDKGEMITQPVECHEGLICNMVNIVMTTQCRPDGTATGTFTNLTTETSDIKAVATFYEDVDRRVRVATGEVKIQHLGSGETVRWKIDSYPTAPHTYCVVSKMVYQPTW
jgi:hypothetical protein